MDASCASQGEHLRRVKAIDYFPGRPFTNADNLVAQIVASAVIDALVKAAAKPPRQPRNLPFISLGSLFIGRDADLDKLHAALAAGKGTALPGVALRGGSAGLARRGSRSNTHGRTKRTIRPFCSCARRERRRVHDPSRNPRRPKQFAIEASVTVFRDGSQFGARERRGAGRPRHQGAQAAWAYREAVERLNGRLDRGRPASARTRVRIFETDFGRGRAPETGP